MSNNPAATRPSVTRVGRELPDTHCPWRTRAGKFRPAILLWALGVPIPLILIFLVIRGCM